MNAVSKWATHLGYDRIEGAFVEANSTSVDLHPFAPELRNIFDPDFGVGAEAVFCVDQVPTVCMISRHGLSDELEQRRAEVRLVCEKLWNQNLARVMLVADQNAIEVWSVDSPTAKPETYNWDDAGARSAWSVSGLLGGEALQGRDNWFDSKHRVDKHLLDNIQALVANLVSEGLSPSDSRRLIARVIFVTYLEDRGIVGASYRESRKVRSLLELAKERDAVGLDQLFGHLRDDLNGDFLSSADDDGGWDKLSAKAFGWIADFLSRTSLRSGQTSFWRYDFSHIPIELIASIYETFLASKDIDQGVPASSGAKRRQGAYYTPRLLADWIIDLSLQDRNILEETVFDPACGSGMLLTAAYRRLIRAHEVQQVGLGRKVLTDFETRKSLLVEHIYGGDIDEDACQLTAFSLYLALLSDLTPKDLAELQAGGHKLPSLAANIRRGPKGDFFSAESELANRERFTLIISNPPWRQLSAGEPALLALESWRVRQPAPTPHIPKRQIAAGFALGAADVLKPGGRVALILPVNPFVSADTTQRNFRAHLVGRLRILKIVNFSDMRRLIFSDAVHPFVVIIADSRNFSDRFKSIDGEDFEYWTPKADISLSLGRLAVHGADRADLPTAALIDVTPQLAIRYWGSNADVRLLARLQRRGRIGDLITKHGWLDAKGFHAKDEDQRRAPESWYVETPKWMADVPFLAASSLPRHVPVVTSFDLQKLPFARIAREAPERLFKGPRVLWTDGAHPEDGVKAVFADRPFSFQHSLAVLSAPDDEEGRLTARFLTAYLRSPLGLWLLFLLSSSVASERPKLHVQEALDWPFWSLPEHPEPLVAREVMLETDALLSKVEQADVLAQPHEWKIVQDQIHKLIYRYFDLEDDEIDLVEELSSYAGPAVQPASLSHQSMMKPLRQRPSKQLMEDYCTSLVRAMKRWRNATNGQGEITASAWGGHTVPIGAAVLALNGLGKTSRLNDDLVIEELASAFERLSDDPANSLMTVPDLALVEGNRIFLVKPLVARFWLKRRAIEDAGRLAQQLQALSPGGTV